MNEKKIIVDYEKSIKINQNLKIVLKISNEFGYLKNVKAIFNKNGEQPGQSGAYELKYNPNLSSESESVFEAEISFSDPGYKTFYIESEINGCLKKIKYNKENEEVVLVQENENYDFFECFVYLADFETPDWVKGGIMYQIFVDTFSAENIPENIKDKLVDWSTFPKWQPDADGKYRNNQFYGGNIRGIINHLSYIKSLNVTVLYLTPIFKSPSSNIYDISDYEEIDEMIGTWEELDELREKANSMGIHIVVDCVFNHASNENKLFSEFPDAFDWEEKYTEPKCWWGYKHLVEFCKTSDVYKENLSKWLEKYVKHVDGIRLDVADCLPDFILKLIREHFNKYILGEVWKNAITGDYRGFFYGDELDGVMNYQFANAIYRYIRWGNAKNFKNIVKGINELYPPQALAVSPIFLSSHDIPRIRNILVGDFMKEDPNFENVWDMECDEYWMKDGEFDTLKFREWEVNNLEIPEDKKELAFKLMKLAVFLQYTLPGLPSVFAGDEVGVNGFKDPTNRRPFPWENINYNIYSFYQQIGKFRIDNRNVFSNYDFKIISIDDKKIIYQREKLIFIVNRTNEKINLPEYKDKKVLYSLYENDNASIISEYNAIVIE